MYIEEQEAIKEKIHKLISLSMNNPSGHEALAAKQKAEALCKKYQLKIVFNTSLNNIELHSTVKPVSQTPNLYYVDPRTGGRMSLEEMSFMRKMQNQGAVFTDEFGRIWEF